MIRHVHKSLSTSNVVYRGDAAMFNAKVLHDNFDHRSKTVGSTTSVGNQLQFLLEQMVIAPKNNIQCSLLLHWCTNNYALHATFSKVCFKLSHLQELSSALHYHLNILSLPINFLKVRLLRKGDQFSINSETASILGRFYFLIPSSVDGIVFDEVGS